MARDAATGELFLEPPGRSGLKELVALADESGARWSLPGFFTLPDGTTVFHVVVDADDEFMLAALFTGGGWSCHPRPT